MRQKMQQSPPNYCLLLATTGISAMNLGGDAVTLNSALGYFDTNDMEEKYQAGWLAQRLRRLRQTGVRRLILDEVSMMESRQLSCLMHVIDSLNGEGEALLDPELQLGLTLVGDFLQLPPVDGDFAFFAPEWDRFQTEKLTTQYRQTDPAFLQALNAARNEDLPGLVRYFMTRMHRTQDMDFDGTTILAKNQHVDRMNQLRHDRLPGTPIQFLRTVWGKERKEWREIPVQLLLKPGALVMVLANRYKGDAGFRELHYANGELGHFMGQDKDGRAIVELAKRQIVVEVEPITRQNEEVLKDAKFRCTNQGCKFEPPDGMKRVCPQCGGKIRRVLKEVVGEITYMPLRLAWATTVHKSQGLTLDQVQINISDPFFSQPGMLYVSLSRAKTPEGLRLVGTIDLLKHRCRMDPVVRNWA